MREATHHHRHLYRHLHRRTHHRLVHRLTTRALPTWLGAAINVWSALVFG